jgi:hypothetical protein
MSLSLPGEDYIEDMQFGKRKKKTKLPPIIRKPLVMEINEQMSVTLFPEKNGQPKIDLICLSLKQCERNVVSVYLTPCEAMEIVAGLSSAVQFYLYNQEQYRKEVLEPRLEIAKKRTNNRRKNVKH